MHLRMVNHCLAQIDAFAEQCRVSGLGFDAADLDLCGAVVTVEGQIGQFHAAEPPDRKCLHPHLPLDGTIDLAQQKTVPS